MQNTYIHSELPSKFLGWCLYSHRDLMFINSLKEGKLFLFN